MFSVIASFFMNIFSGMGYIGIIVLMTIESSFIPFPSEIVIPPAAYLAQKGEMNLLLVISCGVIGSLLGALINYFLAATLGRTFIYSFAKTKLAKILLIDEKGVKKSEDLFNKNGIISTFFGRLIPGVRQLISIPAGLAKMNIISFIVFTILGAAIWNTVLALLGYFFGANENIWHTYYKEIKIIGIIIGVIIIAYFIFKYINNKSKKTKINNTENKIE